GTCELLLLPQVAHYKQHDHHPICTEVFCRPIETTILSLIWLRALFLDPCGLPPSVILQLRSPAPSPLPLLAIATTITTTFPIVSGMPPSFSPLAPGRSTRQSLFN
ncbi:hypothetical protein PTTG_30201, partial [Puccinia triticina 1-1 BBBD Race 1]